MTQPPVVDDWLMLPGDSLDLRKARGAFFTPPTVARFINRWAIRSADDAVLEPSCGEAIFLHEAGVDGGHRGALVGVELHRPSAAEAERTLRAEGIKADVHVGDFFLHDEFGSYDAAVGNPPYVRFFGLLLDLVIGTTPITMHERARQLRSAGLASAPVDSGGEASK